VSAKKQTKQQEITASGCVAEDANRIMINSEYKRGKMEGQMLLIKQLASFLDHLISQYNAIALTHRLEVVRHPLPPA